MATKTLTLDALYPDQTPAKGTRFTVTVDRDVALIGSGVIVEKGAVLDTLTVTQDGTFPTMPVTPNDDTTLEDWSQGYRLLIAAEQTPLGGITGAWSVAVTSALADTVRLSSLPPAQAVPVQYSDVASLVAAVTAAQDATAASAAAAAASAHLAGAPADEVIAAAISGDTTEANAAVKGVIAPTVNAVNALSAAVTDYHGLRAAIDRTPPVYVGTLRGLGGAHIQSFELDPVTGHYYAAVGDVGTTQDMYVYHLGPDLAVIDYAILTAAGHGSSIALSRDSDGTVWIWSWWVHDTSGAYQAYRWRYSGTSAGKTVARTDADVQTLPNFYPTLTSSVVFSVDAKNNRVATRRTSSDGTNSIVDVFDLDDLLAGANNPLGTVTFPFTPDGMAWQGFQLVDDDIYSYSGGSSSASVEKKLFRYSWNPTGSNDSWDLSYIPGEGEGVTLWRSADGTPTLLINASVNAVPGCRNNVYAFPALGGDTLQLGTAQSQAVRIQSGSVLVTPSAAGTVTEATVTFPFAYDKTPRVVACAVSKGSVSIQVCVSDITTTTFAVELTRGNTIATTIEWIAVGQ